MATFPTTLPLPQPSGYKMDPMPQGIETDMEVGEPRIRRRSAARRSEVSLMWIFTEVQYQAFLTWFYDDSSTGCAGGCRWFDMQLLVGEGGLTAKEARFKGSEFKASLISGVDWSVSATLRVR